MNHDDAWKVAAIEVWEGLPVEFDTLLVEYRGEANVTSYSDLEAEFGARPDGLVEEEIVEMLAGGFGRMLVTFGVIGVIALVPILVLVRGLLHRHRRERDRARRTG